MDLSFYIPLLYFILPLLYGRKCPMNKPKYSQPAQPPGIVFAIVWSILYLLNSYSLYRVLKFSKNSVMKKIAVVLSTLAIMINMYYIHVAGCEKKWRLALWVLVLYTIIVLTQMMVTFAVDNVAGVSLAPLLGWCIFATQLNMYIVNKEKF